MPKNRVIYQTEAVYAGASPATGEQFVSAQASTNVVQLHRVQSANYGYSVTRRDVNQFGELAAIDRIILETPTVNLDLTYLNNGFFNEDVLGFYVNIGNGPAGQVSCISGILAKTEDERNYYIRTSAEGVDAVGDQSVAAASASFTNIGNGFISNFTAEGAVGDFPRTSVTIEALNVSFENSQGSAQAVINGTLDSDACVVWNPAVNPVNGTKVTGWAIIPVATTNPSAASGVLAAVSVLRPGDITFGFVNAGTNTALNEAGPTISDAKIQSYNLSFSLSREALQKLGSKYAFAREITFPVNITLRIDAAVGDLTTGNLADVISADKNYDCHIYIKNPSGTFNQMVYSLKDAKLESQNYTSSIGPNKSVSLVFTSQIGGPNQTTKGLFFSGRSGTATVLNP
jgi:hypothetical protein